MMDARCPHSLTCAASSDVPSILMPSHCAQPHPAHLNVGCCWGNVGGLLGEFWGGVGGVLEVSFYLEKKTVLEVVGGCWGVLLRTRVYFTHPSPPIPDSRSLLCPLPPLRSEPELSCQSPHWRLKLRPAAQRPRQQVTWYSHILGSSRCGVRRACEKARASSATGEHRSEGARQCWVRLTLHRMRSGCGCSALLRGNMSSHSAVLQVCRASILSFTHNQINFTVHHHTKFSMHSRSNSVHKRKAA
jgi:hypothetical protein